MTRSTHRINLIRHKKQKATTANLPVRLTASKDKQVTIIEHQNASLNLWRRQGSQRQLVAVPLHSSDCLCPRTGISSYRFCNSAKDKLITKYTYSLVINVELSKLPEYSTLKQNVAR